MQDIYATLDVFSYHPSTRVVPIHNWLNGDQILNLISARWLSPIYREDTTSIEEFKSEANEDDLFFK